MVQSYEVFTSRCCTNRLLKVFPLQVSNGDTLRKRIWALDKESETLRKGGIKRDSEANMILVCLAVSLYIPRGFHRRPSHPLLGTFFTSRVSDISGR